MLESLIYLLHTLVLKYGLLGLFVVSCVISTIFVPLMVEPLLFLLVRDYSYSSIIASAAFGSLAGNWINYAIGYSGFKIIQLKKEAKEVKKLKKLMNTYGSIGLFAMILLPLPVPVDLLGVICGLGGMDFTEFSIIVLLSKILRYAILLDLFKLFF